MIRMTTIADEETKSKLGIAIVDDDKDNCAVLSMALRKAGYRIELVAHDGQKILEAVQSGQAHPDVIIMDYHMPVMDGLKAAELILQARPSTNILLVTGDDEAAERGMAMGLYVFLKPINRTKLAELLQDLSPDEVNN
jgi:CheY-like chemotaxis protein